MLRVLPHGTSFRYKNKYIFAYLLFDLRAENVLHCGVAADGCKLSWPPEVRGGGVAAITRKGVQDRDGAAVGGRSDCWTNCWSTETRDTPTAVVPISRGSYDNNQNRSNQGPEVPMTTI
jgi:hypothetical protein